MAKVSNAVKRFLYKRLSLEKYLGVVSRMFFIGYGLGLGRKSTVYEYPRFLKHLVRAGDTVIDIGANLGYYSRILCRLVGPTGKVYAVEPVKPILNVLKRNVRRCGSVEIMPYALGLEEKSILMGNDSSRWAGYMGTGRNRVLENTSSPTEARQCREAARREQPTEVTYVPDGGYLIEFAAEMKRGSRLFAGLTRLDFIKCDIEGYETVVIPEMAPVIEKHMPVVLIETGGSNRRVILELLREWGYAGYVLKDGRLRSLMREEGDKDIVFIPGHRLHDFGEVMENER